MELLNYVFTFVLGILVTTCYGREPFKPFHGTVPFMVSKFSCNVILANN